ncbi:Protein of unknown function (DUF3099) [Knoellia remsis]|uniref:DUF3099 family protein n=1 Tax=Knoellia remsis TaxID=407159 RepID=A0A2T0TSI8_9MICO|nr:DUF3099 domain-containing protein [Knoellia remsis]PRY48621.1 Protein of unknown function (DUF3099) [Knoellia remsis]
MNRHGTQPVQSVTTAPTSADDDLNARIKQYLVTMGIRTACFVAAFFTQGWVRWTCVALAVVLPYIAVLFANAHAPRRAGRLTKAVPRNPHQQQLGR